MELTLYFHQIGLTREIFADKNKATVRNIILLQWGCHESKE
jgi:hypothetical protein